MAAHIRRDVKDSRGTKITGDVSDAVGHPFFRKGENLELKPRAEILAPAGSWESMAAAINAGADAVYMGGSRFGARAYADNPEEDRFLEAIDYAHLHGCRLYMTVNTLVKERELKELGEFLVPYYRRGLDAVIVQDMGVFSYIRKRFPDLPVHASTQMTVTGYHGARILKELGASRVVTARELSLEEIAKIRDEVDIEIESFVHGALCYCYSGQCLLSSLIGGRSGNRGRCAQPCRLPYDVKPAADGKAAGLGPAGKQDERYVLSLKDLCTLDILPDILEAGVFSLKIEGRMKSPRYTAGVVSIYRKYVDRYLEHGRKGYRVDPADRKMLLELFDRGGFTDGYYKQHNGRDMVALKEKPSFREGNQALFNRLDAEYVDKKAQEPIWGKVTLKEGQPASLTLTYHRAGMSNEIQAEVLGDVVQRAQNQPITEEKLIKQMKKTGGTPFVFERLEAELSGFCFMPVQALNELRRSGLEKLTEAILGPYRRELCGADDWSSDTVIGAGEAGPLRIHVSLESPDALEIAVWHPDVGAVYLDAVGFDADGWAAGVETCHKNGKECALVFPHIFRTEAETYFRKYLPELTGAGFDELVIRSMEEVDFLKELGVSVPMVFDAGMYAMNHQALTQMMQLGAARLTLPLELNSRELNELGYRRGELVGYGYLPAMVSAQCIRRTVSGCDRKPGLLNLKDRMGKELPVKNHCRFCYNTIYNPSPLSLLGQEKMVEKLDPSVLRLQFTIETPQQVKAVIDAYADHFLYGKDSPAPFADFTRGHMKRGVE